MPFGDVRPAHIGITRTLCDVYVLNEEFERAGRLRNPPSL
jgi:hypothetical protein